MADFSEPIVEFNPQIKALFGADKDKLTDIPRFLDLSEEDDGEIDDFHICAKIEHKKNHGKQYLKEWKLASSWSSSRSIVN